ncbi:MAG: hypothetical protein U0521_18560 [Anaerolineae bacterium]
MTYSRSESAGSSPALAVAQGVDQAEGDVGEAQPVEVDEARQRRILPGAAAPQPGDFGRQRRALEGDEQHEDQQHQEPESVRRRTRGWFSGAGDARHQPRAQHDCRRQRQ